MNCEHGYKETDCPYCHALVVQSPQQQVTRIEPVGVEETLAELRTLNAPALVPPDYDRCQCEVFSGGHKAFGELEYARCSNRAEIVATEKGDPSHRMALCAGCLRSIQRIRPIAFDKVKQITAGMRMIAAVKGFLQ
jgi:hypothetical protein